MTNRSALEVDKNLKKSKGKSALKVSIATYELQYLMNFNSSITQTVAKTMENITVIVFVSMGESNIGHVKTSG